MLLLGKSSVDVRCRRADGSYCHLEMLMVAIHDYKMRFVGHHCLAVDRTREKLLEVQLEALTRAAR